MFIYVIIVKLMHNITTFYAIYISRDSGGLIHVQMFFAAARFSRLRFVVGHDHVAHITCSDNQLHFSIGEPRACFS